MVIPTEVVEASSSTCYDRKYDVFLSFRGADTRLSFTNHLHTALVNANLSTFLDDEEIPTGEFLKPESENAIKTSKASIIVLSENYAYSTWCLDELVLILEQKRNFNQIVIPVFYHVEPTHVRKQQYSFGKAMEKHKLKMEAETKLEVKSRLAEKMEVWKNSLTEVSSLKGKDANGRLETNLIEEIVNDIYSRLGVPISTLPQLIGMGDHIESITSWLEDKSKHTADILTICGIGGIGKTSLANYIYELHRSKYASCSFIGDISRRCARNHGLLDLQKQLYGDISKRNLFHVQNIHGYTSKIWKALAREKALVVLDDIESPDQLDDLLGDKGLHPGSKIIITTKDASLTEKCALFNPRVQSKHIKVLLNGLHQAESLQLLCIHAFKSQKPEEGYVEVSKKIVNYSQGHPLALEVLGKALCNRKDVDEWEYYIEGLKKEPLTRVNAALKMSFNSLPLENDKELFKHIACFFVGIDKGLAETILDACDINTKFGIMNLIDRCLLSIKSNKLIMHQLVQEMGRDLVRQESPHKPWERSRLCCHEESFKVLLREKGMENVIGIALDMRMLAKEKLCGSLQLRTKALNKMDNLKLLQLDYVNINGSYKYISKELRWLRMHGFHLKSIPSDLAMENLVVLDMAHSNIESFETSYNSQRPVSRLKSSVGSSSKDRPLLRSLKILDLSFSEQLRSVYGFFELPVLERLIMSNCTSLVMVCESIKHCVELVFIDLSNCKKLKKLPRTIGMLKKVKTLLLNGCDLSSFPTEIKDTHSLQTLNLNISSSLIVEDIPRMPRCFMSSLPISLVHLSLVNNNMSSESFPMDFGSLSLLKELYLDGNPIVTMPSCVSSLPRLEILSMRHCQKLVTVEHPPSTLRVLKLGHLSRLRKVTFGAQMSPSGLSLRLSLLSLAWSSFVIEGMVKIQPLAVVEDELLLSLGWGNFKLIKYQRLNTCHILKRRYRIRIQMYYEFGIFSTLYGGKEMPKWISFRNKGSSISFTIPSSPNKLRGMTFCYVVMKRNFNQSLDVPVIIINNITKNHTWIYNHYILNVYVVEERLIYLSHWMFEKNEMADGDHIIITIVNRNENDVFHGSSSSRECGVSLVYDDGRMKANVLGYYKSWNHIIGGDLSAFQTTTGEYILSYIYFFYNVEIFPDYYPFISASARSKGERIIFRAFSPNKSNEIGGAPESPEVYPENHSTLDRSKSNISNGELSLTEHGTSDPWALPESSIIQEAGYSLLALSNVLDDIDARYPKQAKHEVSFDILKRCSLHKQQVMDLVSTSPDEKTRSQAIELYYQLDKALTRNDGVVSCRLRPCPERFLRSIIEEAGSALETLHNPGLVEDELSSDLIWRYLPYEEGCLNHVYGVMHVAVTSRDKKTISQAMQLYYHLLEAHAKQVSLSSGRSMRTLALIEQEAAGEEDREQDFRSFIKKAGTTLQALSHFEAARVRFNGYPKHVKDELTLDLVEQYLPHKLDCLHYKNIAEYVALTSRDKDTVTLAKQLYYQLAEARTKHDRSNPTFAREEEEEDMLRRFIQEAVSRLNAFRYFLAARDFLDRYRKLVKDELTLDFVEQYLLQKQQLSFYKQEIMNIAFSSWDKRTLTQAMTFCTDLQEAVRIHDGLASRTSMPTLAHNDHRSVFQKARSALQALRYVLIYPKKTKDKFMLDLVKECSYHKHRVIRLAVTSRDENTKSQAIELNDQLRKALLRYDDLVSGRSKPTLAQIGQDVEEEEDSEQLFRRMRKGKACVTPEAENHQIASCSQRDSFDFSD